MSYDLPPSPPLPYPMPSVPQPGRRPTSVTVISIIAIIWGSLAVLGGLCSIPQYMGVRFGPNPVADAINSDPVVVGFNISAMAVAVVLGIMMLAGGIAALSLKPIGRGLLIVYAIAQIAVSIVSVPVQAAIVYPHMMAAVQSKTGASSPIVAGMRIGFGAGLVFGLITLAWPIVILIFMSRPHVKAAFESAPEQA